jgi:hypothetical protein
MGKIPGAPGGGTDTSASGSDSSEDDRDELTDDEFNRRITDAFKGIGGPASSPASSGPDSSEDDPSGPSERNLEKKRQRLDRIVERGRAEGRFSTPDHGPDGEPNTGDERPGSRVNTPSDDDGGGSSSSSGGSGGAGGRQQENEGLTSAQEQDIAAAFERESSDYRQSVQGVETGGSEVARQAQQLEQQAVQELNQRQDRREISGEDVRVERTGDTLQADLLAGAREDLGANPSKRDIRRDVASERENVDPGDVRVERTGDGVDVRLTDSARQDRVDQKREEFAAQFDGVEADEVTVERNGDKISLQVSESGLRDFRAAQREATLQDAPTGARRAVEATPDQQVASREFRLAAQVAEGIEGVEPEDIDIQAQTELVKRGPGTPGARTEFEASLDEDAAERLERERARGRTEARQEDVDGLIEIRAENIDFDPSTGRVVRSDLPTASEAADDALGRLDDRLRGTVESAQDRARSGLSERTEPLTDRRDAAVDSIDDALGGLGSRAAARVSGAQDRARDVRSNVLGGLESGRQNAVGAVDDIDMDVEGIGGDDAQTAGSGLAGAALVGVAAPEPVSTAGGAAVLGGLAAGAIATDALAGDELRQPRDQRQEGELPVAEPGVDSELDIGGGFESELQVSEDLGRDSELPIAEGPTSRSEISIDDIAAGTGAGSGILGTSPMTIGQGEGRVRDRVRQRQRERERERELQEILEGPEGEVTLGEEPVAQDEQVTEPEVMDGFEVPREFPTGEDAVVGRFSAVEDPTQLDQTQARRSSVEDTAGTGTTGTVDPMPPLFDEDSDQGVGRRVGAQQDIGLESALSTDLGLGQAQAQATAQAPRLDLAFDSQFGTPTAEPTAPETGEEFGFEDGPRFAEPTSSASGRRPRRPDFDLGGDPFEPDDFDVEVDENQFTVPFDGADETAFGIDLDFEIGGGRF